MRSLLFISLLAAMQCSCRSQEIELARGGVTEWKIVVDDPSYTMNIQAAKVLQHYFEKVTSAPIPIIEKKYTGDPHCFVIGGKEGMILRNEGYSIKTKQGSIHIDGGREKGVLFGVYAFIERYLGCRKWDASAADVPRNEWLKVPASINDQHEPALAYREVYFPASFNNEYLDWHGLHRFEEKWGLWGHSFFKLVPPAKFMTSHPEYFSLIDGKRQAIQLCLSNPAVIDIAVNALKEKMADNPRALYWSVSANDDIGPCECTNCAKLDAKDGGPQGSLLYFVNAIAAHFPDKIITTLAYTYTARAPLHTRAAPNVAILLSTIDAMRTKPIETEPTAAAFRRNLKEWKSKCDRIIVWDYNTQFTNYLGPFPVEQHFATNINYFVTQGVSGLFSQGSGNSYSDMAELKSYLLAKLSIDPSFPIDQLTKEFVNGYYRKAAPQVLMLLNEMRSRVKTGLDIYGNPIMPHDDFLSPANMDRYSSLMDEAERAAGSDAIVLQRLQRLRLSQEFTVLQQARFYGKGTHGVYVKNEDGDFVIRPGLLKRVEVFRILCEKNGVKELSEGGIAPIDYLNEWKKIVSRPVPVNLAANAKLMLQYPFAGEYPAKREATLVDETPGYSDFSYNWLCFYGQPMAATIDMGALKNVHAVRVHFLSDARHWIFQPSAVTIEVSADGQTFETIKQVKINKPDEDYTVETTAYVVAVDKQTRFIRVRAENMTALPAWRYHRSKKPMIACDEIWVE